MSTQTFEFIAPRPLRAGEMVRDPATGRHGYARSAAAAGAAAEMVCGDVFVECVADPQNQATPDASVYLNQGVLTFAVPDAYAVPAAQVIRVQQNDPAARTATVMLRTL